MNAAGSRSTTRIAPRVRGALTLLVRTWNLFHGRSFPETRELHLERMVRLVSEGGPAVVCLQELPLWALPRLETWSGMRAVATRTKHALAGPLGRRFQQLHPRWFRSAITGQAMAVLLGRQVGLEGMEPHVLGPRGRRERRMCQLVRARAEGTPLALVNVHLSTTEAAARTELDRLSTLLPAETPAIVCGDLNVAGLGLPGFSEPGSGIDQILVRGLEVVRGTAAWPDSMRTTGKGLLSDHAPLEAEFVSA